MGARAVKDPIAGTLAAPAADRGGNAARMRALTWIVSRRSRCSFSKLAASSFRLRSFSCFRSACANCATRLRAPAELAGRLTISARSSSAARSVWGPTVTLPCFTVSRNGGGCSGAGGSINMSSSSSGALNASEKDDG
eukprot:scaffold23786_cov129-Isochrysis_galbana.AAC.4